MTLLSPLSPPDITMHGLLGKTPLVKLKNMFPQAHVYGKLEFFNPSGSIKDRPIALMIQDAIDTGKVNRGGTVIVPTSGNTGIGACIFAKPHELKVISVLPSDVPLEKINLLAAYGSRVILCDFNHKSDEEGGYVWVAKKLAEAIDNSLLLDQFSHEMNPLSHYLSTGPEIWEQMNGQIDYFFSGVGSGGTISGIGRFLKERDPRIQVIGVEPKGGVNKHAFHQSEYRFEDHLIAGVSDNFLSPNVDFQYIDYVMEIDDKKALQRCHDLVFHDSILVGSSSGLNLEGINQFLKTHREGCLSEKNIVVVFPDSATRYQNSLLNPQYLQKLGASFQSAPHPNQNQIEQFIEAQGFAITGFFL